MADNADGRSDGDPGDADPGDADTLDPAAAGDPAADSRHARGPAEGAGGTASAPDDAPGPDRSPHGKGPGLAPLQGLAMGLADIVPGVSGGTVALAMGIHPRLVGAIAAVDGGLVRAVWGARRNDGRVAAKAALRRMDLAFLVLLVLGIGIGVLIGARVLEGLIDDHPVLIAAFFFGLILASARVPWRLMRQRGIGEAIAFLIAGAFAFSITVLDPVSVPVTPWALPLAGAVAICAMILPGISGAFLLLLMGLYDPIVTAIGALDLAVLLPFGLGAAIGILAFARVLDRLLRARPSPTFAALTGLMLGSLGRVWPFRTGGFGDGAPIAPAGPGPVFVALLAALSGAALVLLLEAAPRMIALARKEKP